MKIHIVQKGETLWNIAQKYGVNFDELKKLNAQLSNPEMIMPGMKIKVPGHSGGGAKEKPVHHQQSGQKEMPKAEHPFAPKKEAPMPVAKPPKEKPKKEKPQYIYQPVMPQPQPLPEIDINNYYTMNMQQMQSQQMPQPVPPKEKPVQHEEESPIQEMPVQQPMYGCYPMPQPCFDPCYPYPQPQPYQGYMMPQVQGAMTGAPMMPYQPHMPMPGYGPQTQWEVDESSDDYVGMQQPYYGGTQHQMESSSDNQHMGMGMMHGMAQPYPQPGMQMAGFQQPMPPQANYMNQAGGDCGCGNQIPQFHPHPYGMQGQPMPMQGQMYRGYPPVGTAIPPTYAMPVRPNHGEGNE
ncbi:SafA/ExsA family spore coat assembly protein [Bacillus sp. SD088]|uniref:SafA/ExsA family spore coat assembly protein n=1 Tax=Bacillus sp. SD088 TaxID=2782012 RepID=UPI001A966AC0|nr:SafA/ExsA family spore coat assembly protein [Bacillus sp. SD088]MBO0994070.1 SafA/ExsA family spore coat assembly protein [Bacillus sp. SD088]